MDLVGGRTGAGYQEIQTDLQSGRESAIMDIVCRVSCMGILNILTRRYKKLLSMWTHSDDQLCLGKMEEILS